MFCTPKGRFWGQKRSKFGPNLFQIWSKFGPKTDQKWTENGPKTDQFSSKSVQNRTRFDQALSKTDLLHHAIALSYVYAMMQDLF